MAKSVKARAEFSEVDLGNGKKLVRKYLGPDANGKRRYASRQFPKKAPLRTIRDWYEGERVRFKQPGGIAPTNMSTRDLLKAWFAHMKPRWKTEHTHRQSVGLATRYCKSILPLRAQTLTRAHFQSVFRAMADRGLSDTTIRKTWKMLKQAFDWAVREEMLERHRLPAGADLPKGTDKRAKHVLGTEDARRFVEHARTSKHSALFHLLITTGLRIGEALALEWKHVTGGNVRVEQSLQEVSRGFEVGQPKSAAAVRTVPLTQQVQALLAEVPRSGRYVFAKDGTNSYRSVSSEFKKLVKELDLEPGLTLHDLRDTACTLMLVKGINPKVVSSLIGHSDVGFTLNTYAHFIPEWGHNVADLIEDIYFAHHSHTEKA